MREGLTCREISSLSLGPPLMNVLCYVLLIIKETPITFYSHVSYKQNASNTNLLKYIRVHIWKNGSCITAVNVGVDVYREGSI